MTSKTATKAIAVFFLLFGIALAAFIVMQGTNYYKGSKSLVTNTAEPSVNCVKFFYEISDMSYSEGELSFRLNNLGYSEDIKNITVTAGEAKSYQLSLPKGTAQQVKVPATLSGKATFDFYPEDCSIYKTTCSPETGQCKLQ